MSGTTKRILYWVPRVLTIVFAVFISLFALDVFGEGYGPWETVLALLIHLVPTYLVLIALAIAWRWEWVGAILFAGLGVLYIVVFWKEMDWVVSLLIPGPLFLLGGLFAANWFLRPLRRDPS